MKEWEELKETLGLIPKAGYEPSDAFRSLEERVRLIRLKKGTALPETPVPEVYILRSGVLYCAVEQYGGAGEGTPVPVIDNILWKPGTMYFDIHRVTESAYPVRERVIAAEDSVLLSLPIHETDAVNLAERQLFHLYAKRHEENLTDLWTRKNVLQYMSAPERYEWFLENYPGLIGRIQHKLIASFLNMTPVSLSRIRHRMREADRG